MNIENRLIDVLVDNIPNTSEYIVKITIWMERKTRLFQSQHKETYQKLLDILENSKDEELILSIAKAIYNSKEEESTDYILPLIKEKI